MLRLLSPRLSALTSGLIVHAGLASLWLAGVWLLAVKRPAAYALLVIEDGWFEMSAAVLWLLSSGLATWAAKTHRPYRRPGWILFAAGCFVMGMEEISWGQRLLGLETPEGWARINQQGEMSLHNLVRSKDYYEGPLIGSVAFLWAVVLPLLARLHRGAGRLVERFGVPTVPAGVLPWFVILIGLSLTEETPALPERLEVVETTLALTVAAVALQGFLAARQRAWRHGARGALAHVSLLLWAAAMTLPLVELGWSEGRGRWQLQKLARQESMGRFWSAVRIYEFLLEAPGYEASTTRFEFALLLAERSRSRAEEEMRRAVPRLERVHRRDPENSSLHRALGHAWRLLGEDDKADAILEAILAADRFRLDQTADPDQRALLHASLAYTLEALGRVDEASREHGAVQEEAVTPRTFRKLRDLRKIEKPRLRAIQRWVDEASAH